MAEGAEKHANGTLEVYRYIFHLSDIQEQVYFFARHYVSHFYFFIVPPAAIASGITYPHTVVRSRLMDNRDSMTYRETITSVVKRLVRREGFKALWSGFKIDLFRVLPFNAIIFMTYEKLKNELLHNNYFNLRYARAGYQRSQNTKSSSRALLHV
eukprot:TRINITY_DN1097_c0_g1_i19.p1 TRINITY_DN1097_c0_g1~~TRINITY_DN1097_c0_g1_i19.p1  ORF type:complete len:155 (+),score=0.30 TRINITY_DN1097_c0_g1_i19:103-567(+)